MQASRTWIISAGIPSFSRPRTRTVLCGKLYLSSGMLFAVCSSPKIEKPSRFFLSKKFFTLLTGTSIMGTHFSAVTLINWNCLSCSTLASAIAKLLALNTSQVLAKPARLGIRSIRDATSTNCCRLAFNFSIYMTLDCNVCSRSWSSLSISANQKTCLRG
uniref:Uncharacterized protein n=1 Tax=Opuntia streptacantha TaxID=393608 RepID=A0A7C9AK51_OPUST